MVQLWLRIPWVIELTFYVAAVGFVVAAAVRLLARPGTR
jgi:hypothetical protein